MNRDVKISALKLLSYSFKDIEYNYDQLTDSEKSLITREVFNELVNEIKLTESEESNSDKRKVMLTVVVDYINDFVNGVLGSKEAELIEDNIVNQLNSTLNYDKSKYKNSYIVFLYDEHSTSYLKEREGKHLPIEHCIVGTKGCELYGKVKDWYENNKMNSNIILVPKSTFGCNNITNEFDYPIDMAMDNLGYLMNSEHFNNEELLEKMEPNVKRDDRTYRWNTLYETYCNLGNKSVIPDEIYVMGIATHICVMNNVAILMTDFPQAEIFINRNTVADYNPKLGENALDIMKDWGVNID